MLVVTILAARWVVRRFAIPPQWRRRLAVGLLALVLMLIVEFTIVLWLRGMTIQDYLAGRDPVSGAVYAALLLLFAVSPALVARR